MLCLEVKRLSPLIDSDESRLKIELIDLKEKSTEEIVNSLSQLVAKVSSEECQRKKVIRQATLPKESQDNENSESDLESLPVGKKLSVSYKSAGSYYEKSTSVGERKSRANSGEPNQSLKRKLVDTEDNSDGKDLRKENDDGDAEDDEEEDIDTEQESDIHAYAEKVISDARYKAFNADALQVPPCLKINQEKVADLKHLLMSTPDKTQTWCGGVVVVDEEGVRVSPVWVYVNQEIYVAMQELACEGRNTDRIPVVLHVVHEGDPVDVETLGLFLHTNSKDFTARLHDKMFYQDVFAFCSTAVVNESGENIKEIKTFLKKTLKSFSKGSQNVPTFLNFASLPVGYLNKFEQFIRLFETGSLNGQKLSFRKVRNIDKNCKRKTTCRLEVPLSLFKLHLTVSQNVREKLLFNLLTKKIEFAVYMEMLKDASNISDVKKEVEKISKKPFAELVEKDPDMFVDEVLLAFAGAKSNASGLNRKHELLVSHVNVSKKKEGTEKKVEQFVNSDGLNVHSLGRKFKEYNVIILNCAEDEMKDHEFCLKEQVKDTKCTVGIIIKDEKGLREDMTATFCDDDDIVIIYIYIKVKKPQVIDGVRIEVIPIVVFGHKDNFKSKEVNNFHNLGLNEALQFVLNDLVSSQQKVLYSFASIATGIDIDLMGMLKRKGVQISYLARKEILIKFKENFSLKVK